MGTRNLPPKAWMLGSHQDPILPHLPEQQTGVTGGDETEVNLATCITLPDDSTDGPLSLTAFKGELDSAVSQYISQVKDLGYKEETPKDQKLLAVKFQLDPDDIKPKSEEEEEDVEEEQPKIKVISREDKGEQTELQVELPSLDNPLYLTLSECSSGLLPYSEDLPHHHHYENGQVGREDEHIYENVDNSTGEEEEDNEEEHLYDTLPRRKPDLPPKPDFLSQLAARQSEPVKRAWNPFVSLSVDTGDPTPPPSTASSLSSPDSHLSNEHPEVSPQKASESTTTNPFVVSRPRETSEQTLILDGSETSDLGSSGGEYDVGSVEDWPLPPTPPPGEEEVTVQDDPLPPPPPELALQQLEEEVFREEQEEKKIALQKEKEAIEREYGSKTQDPDEAQRVEAVNTTLTSLEEKFEKPVTETQALEPEPEKEPKIIQVDEDDSEEFDTPAIRHSVIIELKDSCPSVPQSIRPSEIRRKESLRRSESVKHTSVLRRTNSYNKVSRRESLCKVFPSIKSEFKKSENGDSVCVGVTSPKREEPSFTFLDTGATDADQVIEISEDGSWETKQTSMDSLSNTHSNREDIDPFTGNPIMAPPLSPVTIAAPPTEFQTDDGMDGVYCANVVNTYSGPSSLASTAADSLGSGEGVAPETPTLLTASKIIPEEPPSCPQEPVVEDRGEIASERVHTEPQEEKEVRSPAHKNLGVAIMEGYEQELQKKKDSMNLPEHSLLEFGDTVRDLEQQRRSVIKQMTVKAKRKDTWIKTFNMHSQGNDETIPVAPSRCRRKNSPQRPETAVKAAVVTHNTNDLSVNALGKKTEPGIVQIQRNNLEASASQNTSLKTTMSPTKTVESVPPPIASRRGKKKVEPQPPPIPAPVNSENSQTVAEEVVISPKNTEILAALFSSPTKTARNIDEHKVSSQNSPKKLANDVKSKVDDEVTHDLPTPVVEPAENLVVVEELVSISEKSPVMLEAAPPVTNTTPEDLLSAESQEPTPVPDLLDFSPPKSPEEPLVPVSTSTAKEEEEVAEEEDAMVREKNEINLAHSALAVSPSSEEDRRHEEEAKEVEEEKREESEVVAPVENSNTQASETTEAADPEVDEGEVEYFSILDNKVATKTYWESRMLATMDDGGWESVANVRFQPIPGPTPVIVQTDDAPETVTPPPEFIPAPPPQFDNSPVESEESSPPSLEVPSDKQSPVPPAPATTPDARPTKKYVYGISDTPPKEMRNSARIVETVAKKPPSQENVIEAEIRAQQLKEVEMRQQGIVKSTVVREKGASSPASHDSDEGFVDRLAEDVPPVPNGGYTHAIPGNDGEPVIYDAVSPPPEYFCERNTPTPTASNTETKIALEIRELKEREEELRQMRERLMGSRDNLLDDEEVRSSASREQLLEDHLTSLTTTTDEGNFSECGDPASSEDKSSDGSNSRIMSPDLHHPGTNLDYGRRKVTVKPFEDEEEDQPVYTRMQKESVIEREIRLAREREEAYRREKGLTNSSINSSSSRSSGQTARATAVANNDGRDVQHRIATNRIQLEIQETSMKEKELKNAGKILTMSEETVDAKVTRMSDFTDLNQNESSRTRPVPSRPSNFSTPSSTPKRSPSPRSPSSPVPTFTSSSALSRGLSRSLSTNNLASPTSLANPRAPKGLMQKFIASRGKMTGSAFASPPPTLSHTTPTSRGIPTRPMRVEPKAAVVQRETLARMKPQLLDTIPSQEQTIQTQKQQTNLQQQYRRSYCTAEEKIQSELKEMQMREEELRQLRAHQLAQSQPNLMDLGAEEDEQEEEESNYNFEEVNGLRTAHSNPNLLDDEPDKSQAMEKGVRRRSALIAQWENRIQQTTDT